LHPLVVCRQQQIKKIITVPYFGSGNGFYILRLAMLYKLPQVVGVVDIGKCQ